jgi:3-deoxy-manno-octulosonate cytidylyltransferase (CMP-KDO synthetase)
MKKRSELKFAGIIPARYTSSRFPGKPLAMINGKPMVQRVYEQSRKSLDTVFVATDDKRIFDAVKNFGGNAVMTSSEHQSGTDRCAEAIGKISRKNGIEVDVVVNIQGDEPFIRPEEIDLLKSCFNDKNVEIATLIRKAAHGEDLFNPNQPKVVIESLWSENFTFYKHLGLYAYTIRALKKITKLPVSYLEKAEALEQNRWIENGYRIRSAVTEWESIGIDTPADLDRALLYFENLK